MKQRILIVDDEPVLAELLVMKLEQDKDSDQVEIVFCSDSRQAETKLRTERFDLLMTDINMPHLNGQDLVRIARKIFRHRIVIVMMTGLKKMNATIIEQCKPADCFEKPFTPLVMDAVVNRIMRLLWIRPDWINKP